MPSPAKPSVQRPGTGVSSSRGPIRAPAPIRTPLKTELGLVSSAKTLREATAADIAKTLSELYRGDDAKKLRITYHAGSNSVIFRGRAEDIEEAEAMTTRQVA